MDALKAAYFDGQSSRRHSVSVTVSEGVLHLAGEGVDRREPLAAVRVSEPMGPARILSFADGAQCEVTDLDGLARLLAATGHQDGWVARVQRRWDVALASFAVIAVVLAAGYTWLLPWAAERIARVLPELIVLQIERNVMMQIDHVLPPSELAPARQEALQARFAGYARVLPHAPPVRVAFRRGGPVGANALALPGGQIIVTDELVLLARDDDDVAAVVSHELGHVAGLHGLRQAVHSTVIGLVVGWMVGDFSSVLAIAPTVYLQTHYSREFEREADDYGARLMRANGLSPSRLADMLERMQQRQMDVRKDAAGAAGKSAEEARSVIEDYFSSHPSTAERLRRLREN